MTQPYGQQPGQQPGGYPQGQQPGGYPQAPGYQQGMGGMPAAPQEYSQGPIARPGSVTAAAVLAYIQAGITTITTLLLFIGLANATEGASSGAQTALGWIVALAQLAGIVLLIMGAVQIMGGKTRTTLIAGAALELAICVYYLIQFSVAETGNIDLFEDIKGALIAIAIGFAVMPAISLIMSIGANAKSFVDSRRA